MQRNNPSGKKVRREVFNEDIYIVLFWNRKLELDLTYFKRSNFIVNLLYSNLTCANITALTSQINQRSMTNFSLQYQHIVKQSGDENKENHQQGDTVLMYHQILKTDIQINLWQ